MDKKLLYTHRANCDIQKLWIIIVLDAEILSYFYLFFRILIKLQAEIKFSKFILLVLNNRIFYFICDKNRVGKYHVKISRGLPIKFNCFTVGKSLLIFSSKKMKFFYGFVKWKLNLSSLSTLSMLDLSSISDFSSAPSF